MTSHKKLLLRTKSFNLDTSSYVPQQIFAMESAK